MARGASVATSPRAAVEGAAVIISMLADVPVCRDVWLGRGEALAGAAPGALLVESSTVTVEWIHELDHAAREHGCELVDAPVTGSKAQAASGQLLFLSGGSAAAVNKITPILQAMGREVVHVGPIGSGTRLKLINNFLAGVQVASLAEALSLIERSGLDPQKSLGVLTEGAPGSPVIKLLSGPHDGAAIRAQLSPQADGQGPAVRGQRGRPPGLDLDMGRAALRVFEHAIAAGPGRSRHVRRRRAIPHSAKVKRMFSKLYGRWMYRWETALTTRDTNRIVRPVEWGFEWLQDFAQAHGFRLPPAPPRRPFRGGAGDAGIE